MEPTHDAHPHPRHPGVGVTAATTDHDTDTFDDRDRDPGRPGAPAAGDRRTPPNDIAAEQCVLGAMLLSKDALGDVAEIVRAEDFYDTRHAILFTTILRMDGENRPADPVTLVAELAGRGDLARVGGAPYVHTLINFIPNPLSAAHYARIVADRASRRRLAEAGLKVNALAYDQDGRDADDLVDAAQQTVYDLTTGQRDGGDWSTVMELFQPTLDEIEAAAAGRGPNGLPTGFADLDKMLSGLTPGQLIIVGGRPGMGKSTVGMDIARVNALHHANATAVFSLEMSKVEMVMRILSAEARVPLNVLRSGQLSEGDWTKLARRMGELGEVGQGDGGPPLFLDDTPNMNLMEIRAKARRLKQQHNLKLIVVDYLQLMTSPKRTENRQQEVAEISRGLKLLAKETDCTVIAMSQLNRGPESRTDKRPTLADLRESGSVEQDADVVILLHREDYYDKESSRAGEADLIIAKHRNGPTDTITVAAQLHLCRFVDMAII